MGAGLHLTRLDRSDTRQPWRPPCLRKTGRTSAGI